MKTYSYIRLVRVLLAEFKKWVPLSYEYLGFGKFSFRCSVSTDMPVTIISYLSTSCDQTPPPSSLPLLQSRNPVYAEARATCTYWTTFLTSGHLKHETNEISVAIATANENPHSVVTPTRCGLSLAVAIVTSKNDSNAAVIPIQHTKTQ
ncbi:hypothetical protein C0J52_19331 [Blattella germanica]|nr:hypothetical protein C0J52_19331 [Blattella germanica]